MNRLHGILKKIIKNQKNPFVVEAVSWVNSPGYTAPAKLQQTTVPSKVGYTFVCWLTCVSTGWIGSPYMEHPTQAVTNIWTPTNKPNTTGVSLVGYALMMKNELL